MKIGDEDSDWLMWLIFIAIKVASDSILGLFLEITAMIFIEPDHPINIFLENYIERIIILFGYLVAAADSFRDYTSLILVFNGNLKLPFVGQQNIHAILFCFE